MMRHARLPALILSASFALGVPAWAQGEAPSDAPTPPNVTRADRAQDRLRDLDFLFGALKAAPDAVSAKAVEERIWALWLITPSDTANLLMIRVKEAVDSKDYDLAIRLLDGIITLRPDYVEAWNRRATINYMRKDFDAALDDLRQVLAREPRHFGALSGLGMVLQEFGDDRRALEIYRKALAIHPHLSRIPDLVKSLTEKVEGRGI